MIALRKTAASFGAQMQTLPSHPPPASDQVLIDVAAAGICGSDLHAFEWTRGYEFMAQTMPTTLGHEFAGVVRAVGAGVRDIAVGDRVTCWPTVACRNCATCTAGRPQECADRRIVGLHIDGGFADSVVVPAANCFAVPNDVSLELAALTEPLSVAVNIVDVAGIGPGESVVILGPGPIGIAAAFVARARGCETVVLIGFNDALRLETAKRMGIEHCIDLADESLEAGVRRIVGRPVDKVIEATGVATAVTDGLEILCAGGILVVAGIHSSDLSLDLTRFVRSKKQLRAAHDTTARAIREAIGLLESDGATLSQMITHRFALGDALAAFDVARRKEAVKVLLLPGRNSQLKDAA